MAEVGISALKDMICAQQQLLQKLYNELDAEREASSTAASEALSVILRLQGEKAAVKMEAEQYKRLAEQKMCHAEESLAIFEDVIYQKEMEVADLDYQLRAYRYKLLSAGCIESIDPGEMSLQSIGRTNSVPVSLQYTNPKKGIIDKEGSTDSVELNDQALDNEKPTDNSTNGDINSYWDQIRKLDERVKEIVGVNYGNFQNETHSPSPLSSQLSSGNSRTQSPSPQLSTSNPYDPKRVAIVNEIGQTKSPGNLSENSGTGDSPCSLNVHDVFEVPRVDQNYKTCESQTKDEKKIACQGNESLEKADFVHPEAVKLCGKDEPDWLKKLLQSIHHEKNNLSTIDCRLAVDHATTSISESNQQNGASEILEAERPALGQEFANRMEEMKLLNEIKEQIDSLHYEIKSWKTRKSSPQEEVSLVPLMEDMLHFWL